MKFLLFTLFVIVTFPKDLFAETIRISSGEWEPFLSNYSYEYGLDAHIVTEAFKLEGITVEWAFFPWQRSYQNAKDVENWDASCCWWPDEEKTKEFLVSDVITKTSFVFFHLKSYDFQWSSMQELQELKIGGTVTYDYGKEFINAVNTKTLEVEFATKDEFNFKKLLVGQIQIFPNDPHVGNAQIANSLSTDEAALLTHNPKNFGINTLHLILNKNNKRSKYLLEKFNVGMSKLKAGAQYQQMLVDLEAGKYSKKSKIEKQ